MEFRALVFICYLLSRVINTTYSSVVVYFLIQALSSMGLLFSYFLSRYSTLLLSTTLFIVFLLLKLGLFPFNFWYFFSIQTLPVGGVYLSLTGQKLPPVFLFTYYLPTTSTSVILITFSFLLTLIFSSMMSSTSLTLISLVITSSLFNRSWFLLSSMLNFSLFLSYFIIYSTLLYLLVISKSYISPVLYTLIGLPPFPIFFLKLSVVYLTFLYIPLLSFTSLFIFLSLLSNVAILFLYFNYLSEGVTLEHRSSLQL